MFASESKIQIVFLDSRAGPYMCRFLESKGYSELYHANAASTALSFLENGKILSRCYVEAHPHACWQTRQPSDATDKCLGIFDDVFFDVENLWERGNHFNFYGPVVFKFSAEVLRGCSVEITKYNPIRGRGDLFFSRLEDAENACIVYNSWQFCNHIVARAAGNCIGFNNLEKVIFYCPDRSLTTDRRNDPYAARDEIQQICIWKGIAFENCEVTHRSIPENKYPVFYGFMGKVPRLHGQL